jgi:hypothetical protein
MRTATLSGMTPSLRAGHNALHNALPFTFALGNVFVPAASKKQAQITFKIGSFSTFRPNPGASPALASHIREKEELV